MTMRSGRSRRGSVGLRDVSATGCAVWRTAREGTNWCQRGAHTQPNQPHHEPQSGFRSLAFLRSDAGGSIWMLMVLSAGGFVISGSGVLVPGGGYWNQHHL